MSESPRESLGDGFSQCLSPSRGAAAAAAAAEDDDDFGDWAATAEQAADAVVTGVPSLLVPYLAAWTRLLRVRGIPIP